MGRPLRHGQTVPRNALYPSPVKQDQGTVTFSEGTDAPEHASITHTRRLPGVETAALLRLAHQQTSRYPFHGASITESAS
jgi:hypothetical protein